MKIAIMQPYLFPYIGYFQLIKAADRFIIYDDVNYIKGGWINRNKILLNDKQYMFTVSCRNASQNRLINEHEIEFDLRLQNKLIKTFEHAYKKAPFYRNVISLLHTSLEHKDKNLSNFLTNSIQHICSYLNIDTPIYKSSEKYQYNKGMDKADRLIDITKSEGADHYINPIGGQLLYNKEYFLLKGVHLSFLLPNLVEYRQFTGKFTPNLSIIDVIMFNSKKNVLNMLNQYKLI